MTVTRAGLADGEAAIGYWTFFREPLAAQLASQSGYDFVCIDHQHGAGDFDAVTRMIDAVIIGGATPIARAPSADPAAIGALLDAGALGVIIPMVNTAEEAAAAVRACRYPPAGERSMGAIAATVHHGDDYFGEANDTIMVIPMIETTAAVDHVFDIARTEGIDGLFVGPSDLGASLGRPPALDDPAPEFQSALSRVVDACSGSGVAAGIYASAGLLRQRLDQGFRMISVSTDWDHIINGIDDDLREARSVLGHRGSQ